MDVRDLRIVFEGAGSDDVAAVEQGAVRQILRTPAHDDTTTYGGDVNSSEPNQVRISGRLIKPTTSRVNDANNSRSTRAIRSSTRHEPSRRQELDRTPRLSRQDGSRSCFPQQIEDVRVLIRIYSTPVEVTFKSDNSTRVTLSTIGVLGTFAEKRVSLRPGAYTVIGSRDGCRDVRESILVRPEMQPVEIRCSEIF